MLRSFTRLSKLAVPESHCFAFTPRQFSTGKSRNNSSGKGRGQDEEEEFLFNWRTLSRLKTANHISPKEPRPITLEHRVKSCDCGFQSVQNHPLEERNEPWKSPNKVASQLDPSKHLKVLFQRQDYIHLTSSDVLVCPASQYCEETLIGRQFLEEKMIQAGLGSLMANRDSSESRMTVWTKPEIVAVSSVKHKPKKAPQSEEHPAKRAPRPSKAEGDVGNKAPKKGAKCSGSKNKCGKDIKDKPRINQICDKPVCPEEKPEPCNPTVIKKKIPPKKPGPIKSCKKTANPCAKVKPADIETIVMRGTEKQQKSMMLCVEKEPKNPDFEDAKRQSVDEPIDRTTELFQELLQKADENFEKDLCPIFDKGADWRELTKGGLYCNPEYYSYHKYSYVDGQVFLGKYRLPQPSVRDHIPK